MLELSDQEIKKKKMINMLKVLVENLYNIQTQMAHKSRRTEILQQNQNGMLEIRSTRTAMKAAHSRLISRSNTAKGRMLSWNTGLYKLPAQKKISKIRGREDP